MVFLFTHRFRSHIFNADEFKLVEFIMRFICFATTDYFFLTLSAFRFYINYKENDHGDFRFIYLLLWSWNSFFSSWSSLFWGKLLLNLFFFSSFYAFIYGVMYFSSKVLICLLNFLTNLQSEKWVLSLSYSVISISQLHYPKGSWISCAAFLSIFLTRFCTQPQ